LCDDCGGRIRRGRNIREDAFEVVARPAHERVAEAAEISAVSHFFCENIGDVVFSADVGDSDRTVGDPFACRILLILDVTVALGGHVVTPFDACVVVIVEGGGGLAVIDGVAEVGEARYHVTGVDRESGTHVGSPNFGLARTEGSTLLTFGLPCNGTARSHDDGTAHAAELE
jgi:hypothetical protein